MLARLKPAVVWLLLALAWTQVLWLHATRWSPWLFGQGSSSAFDMAIALWIMLPLCQLGFCLLAYGYLMELVKGGRR